MSLQNLLDRIDTAAATAFLAGLVRQQSYPGSAGEAALAAQLVTEMRSIGLTAGLQPVPGDRHNALGTLSGSGGGQSLMFNGHIDTNPATEGWTVDPWGGAVIDGCLYGLGVSNMKAGDAACFWAVRSLLDAGIRLRGDLVLGFVVGELQGGIGTLALLQSGLRTDCFINAEPTDLAGLTLHAGAFDFTIELTGRTRHVSKRDAAVDVIRIAGELAEHLAQMTFSGAASAEHLAVNRAHAGTLRAALGRDFHDWRPPQVADFARMTGTCRYAPSQTEDSVLADLRRLLSGFEARFPGLTTEVTLNHRTGTGALAMPPFEVARDSLPARAVGAAYRQVRGQTQPQGPVAPYCFYGTDASHLWHLGGMPGIVCGPGGKFNTMPDERVELRDYHDMIRIYLLAILLICQPEDAALADELDQLVAA